MILPSHYVNGGALACSLRDGLPLIHEQSQSAADLPVYELS
jgi:hypothetical protein